jgi:hypothetical protein
LPQQWECNSEDNKPVEPQASETYKNNRTFDKNTWSSSDDEGMFVGYDSSGIALFCEHRKSGKQVHSNQMVIPGTNDLQLIEKYSEQKNDQDQIDCGFVPIKNSTMTRTLMMMTIPI